LYPQISLYEFQTAEMSEREQKHEKMTTLYNYLLENKKLIFNRGDKQRYYLFVTREISDGILLCKFARSQELKTHNITDDDIDEQVIKDYPFIYFVFHLPNQSFLLEKKTTVFSKPDSAKNALEDLLNEKMSEYHAKLSILPISNEMSFWNEIKDFEELDEVTLFMKSPNLWLGQASTEEALKSLEEEYSNDEVEITLRSNSGAIKPDNRRMRKVIDYITRGGGWWKAKGKKAGVKKTISSKDNVESLSLPKNSLDDISEEVILEINNAIEIEKECNSNEKESS
jgi:hypothetical protein